MTTGSWLITLAPLGLMFGYWFALPEHIRDRAWPMHARFHRLQALRSTQHRTIHWQFTAQEARIKLPGLSPNLQTNGD